MLNTKKLLYILPDLAYVVDLLPTKKEFTFTIQSFRQINGELIKDEAFIPEKIAKLCNKLEKEEYHVILPDFMFTNTIVNIKEESDAKIAEHINTTLLPELGITKETHQIATTVLTQFKGTAKVQLSAAEHEVFSTLYNFAKKSDVTIAGISPLSWTLKSSISLEPSISVLQIGNNIYSALHYIGVDQTNTTALDDISVISETIKTLKGAEPSIQTIYLLSNSLVEEQLKEQLSDTLPIQQLTIFREEDTKMPSYVKQIIESGMKTLSISDFPVPVFTLQPAHKEPMHTTIVEPNDHEVEKKTNTPQDIELPKPSMPVKSSEPVIKEMNDDEPTTETVETQAQSDTPKNQELQTSQSSEKTALQAQDNVEQKKASSSPAVINTPTTTAATAEPIPKQPQIVSPNTQSVTATQTPPPAVVTPTQQATPIANQTTGVDISKFAQPTIATTKTTPTPSTTTTAEKKVIKNKSGVSSMLKMVFITLAVFAVTVAVGIGVGMGILSFSEKNTQTAETPSVVQETPEPTAAPESSASATPKPEVTPIDAENLSILVVNATTKAGYAGTIKALLDGSEVGTVAASNAKGEYDTGVFLLMDEEVPGLVEFVAKATELDVVSGSNDSTIEDTKNQYDGVLVLAE